MKWSNLTLFSKALIAITFAAIIGCLVYFFSPGLKVEKSKSLENTISILRQESSSNSEKEKDLSKEN